MALYSDANWHHEMETKWKEVISRHRPDLCKSIDTMEFVEYLESLKVFNHRTCQTFKSTNGRYNQVSAILTALLKRPFEDFVKFCQALEKSNQRHIIEAYFTLNPGTAPPSSPLPTSQQPTLTQMDARPDEVEEGQDVLRTAWKDLIRNNYPFLVNDIDPDNGLMAYLIGKKIIVEWMQDTFSTKEGRSRRAAAILDHLLLKRPYEDFVHFCEALNSTNQKHIVEKYLKVDHIRQLNQPDSRGFNCPPHTIDLKKSVSQDLVGYDVSVLSNLDWKAVFVETRSILVDEVDASNEFINELLALGVFNSMSYEACEEKTAFFRMEFILDYMRRRPDEDFIRFCSALAKNNQRHIIDNVILKHRVDKLPSPNSCESPAVHQMSGDENVVNRRITHPEEELTSTEPTPHHRNIDEPENEMQVEEPCAGVQVICQPQDGGIPMEEQLIVANPVMPTPNPVMPMHLNHRVDTNDDDERGPADIEYVYVRPCDEQFYEQHHDAYPIFRRTRGVCVIVNIRDVIGLSTRLGTETDEKLLTQLFQHLHFEVQIYHNLDAVDIKRNIEALSANNSLRDHQCFVLFVLSHGEAIADENGRRIDCIYGSDGQKIPVDELLMPLTDARCPNLVGKPRIVFFQACRGKHYQTQTDAPSPPVYRDFLIGYPTQREYLSFRNTELGSWYINALIQVFMEKACNTSLSDMLNSVNGKVSKWSTEVINSQKGQSATYESHLTRSFYFFPGIFS